MTASDLNNLKSGLSLPVELYKKELYSPLLCPFLIACAAMQVESESELTNFNKHLSRSNLSEGDEVL